MDGCSSLAASSIRIAKSQHMFDTQIQRACLLVVVLSGVPLALSAVFGLLAAFFQAATQIQEQCIVFTVKLGVFLVVCFFGAPYAAEMMQQLFWESIATLVYLGKR